MAKEPIRLRLLRWVHKQHEGEYDKWADKCSFCSTPFQIGGYVATGARGMSFREVAKLIGRPNRTPTLWEAETVMRGGQFITPNTDGCWIEEFFAPLSADEARLVREQLDDSDVLIYTEENFPAALRPDFVE